MLKLKVQSMGEHVPIFPGLLNENCLLPRIQLYFITSCGTSEWGIISVETLEYLKH